MLRTGEKPKYSKKNRAHGHVWFPNINNKFELNGVCCEDITEYTHTLWTKCTAEVLSEFLEGSGYLRIWYSFGGRLQ